MIIVALFVLVPATTRTTSKHDGLDRAAAAARTGVPERRRLLAADDRLQLAAAADASTRPRPTPPRSTRPPARSYVKLDTHDHAEHDQQLRGARPVPLLRQHDALPRRHSRSASSRAARRTRTRRATPGPGYNCRTRASTTRRCRRGRTAPTGGPYKYAAGRPGHGAVGRARTARRRQFFFGVERQRENLDAQGVVREVRHRDARARRASDRSSRRRRRTRLRPNPPVTINTVTITES